MAKASTHETITGIDLFSGSESFLHDLTAADESQFVGGCRRTRRSRRRSRRRRTRRRTRRTITNRRRR